MKHQFQNKNTYETYVVVMKYHKYGYNITYCNCPTT